MSRDVFKYNREAWNRQVAAGNRWTVPVTAEQVAAARRGEWSVVLTPVKPVPRGWFGDLRGARVLCLASGGGQQGPLLAAAGASVVVLDASPAQLAQDRAVAERDGLDLRTEEGDMRDLSRFPDGSFDLIFHACSNCFVPDPRPVWREAARVLKPGGALLSGFCLPVYFLVDGEKDSKGEAVIRFRLPYSDATDLTPAELAKLEAEGQPLSFGHTLDAQLAGQLDAGLVLTGFFEDSWEPGVSAISDRIACFAATRAVKPRGGA